MRFVLASNNKNKLREYREMLSGTGIELMSQREAGLMLEAEETGETFEENSLIKANAAADILHFPVIADDSGLMVEALGGAPGVHSARYGGGGLTDGEKCALLLKNMEGKENRAAKFVCVITCVFPEGKVLQVRGECPGRIAEAAKGENGFGYDPVFLVHGDGKTMAELTAEEKNAVSHRGNAMKKFREALDLYMTEGK